MAKVVITVDTDEATIDATINGKSIADVKSVSIYKMVDSYSKNKLPEVDVMISSMTEEVDGVRTSMHICCEQAPSGREALGLGAAKADYDGFVNNPIPSTKDDFKLAGKAVANALMKARK